jgi:phage baseplate assembly protein W
VSAPSTSSFTLVERTLIFADVVTYRVAGSPAQPTLTGTGGETWELVATRLSGTARRLTRFATMVTADATTTVTINCGTTQDAIGWAVTWNVGVDVSGVNGAAGYGATLGVDSAGLAVTTLAFTNYVQPIDPLRGRSTFWNSSVGTTGITPNVGTELVDAQIGGGADPNRIEVSATDFAYASLSCTASNGLLAGLSTELATVKPVIIPSASVLRQNAGFIQGPLSYPNTLFRAGYLNFVVLGYSNQSELNPQPTPTAPGVTFVLLQDVTFLGNFRHRIYTAVVSSNITTTLTVSFTGSGGGCSIRIAKGFIGPIDTSAGGGTGVRQSKVLPLATTTPRSVAFDSPVENTSAILFFTSSHSNSAFARPGWQPAFTTDGGEGSELHISAWWRATPDQTPDVTTSSGHDTAGIALELGPPIYGSVVLETEGDDLYFDEDFQHDAIGDLLTITVPESVRQSIYDRLRTRPGEFRPRPEYGVGLYDFVKQPRSAQNLDQIRQRIIDNLRQEKRLDKVIEVVVQRKEPATLKVYIKALVQGQEVQFRPLTFKA